MYFDSLRNDWLLRCELKCKDKRSAFNVHKQVLFSVWCAMNGLSLVFTFLKRVHWFVLKDQPYGVVI